MKLNGLLLLPLISVAACASGRGPGPGHFGGAAGATFDSPGFVLAAARDQQAKKGCAEAVPAYRVVSAYGKGFDVAQFELGACLLEMSAEQGPEAGLFREEGLFWLRRAAWAGNARAQRALAGALSGALGGDIDPKPGEAMAWALIYGENSDRELFNLPPIDNSVTERLENALSEEEVSAAISFANSFSQISMEPFTPPARESATPTKLEVHQPPQQRRR